MAASTSTSDGPGTSAPTAPPPARSRRRSPGPACQAYSTTSHPGTCSSRIRGASMLVVTTTAPAPVTTMSATPVTEAWSTRLSAPPLYQAKLSGRRSTTAPRRGVGHEAVVEPGRPPGHDVLRALGGRDGLRREMGPGRVTVGVVGVVGPDRRGRDVVAAPPQRHLLLAELGHRLLL